MGMTARSAASRPQDPLRALEERLAGALRPVHPRHNFVQRLRDRFRRPVPEVAVRRPFDWQFLLLTLGAVISVAVLLITLARALFYFFRSKRQ